MVGSIRQTPPSLRPAMAKCDSITVKLAFQEECHRFTVAPAALSLDLLHHKVWEFYRLDSFAYLLSYRDADQDLITLSRPDEVHDLVNELTSAKPSIKLFILRKDHPSPAPSETSQVPIDEEPYIPQSVSGLARTRFGDDFTDQEILHILRDISLFICTRAPENATISEPTAPSQVVASKCEHLKLTPDVQGWTMDQVAEWLTRLDYGDYAPNVHENHITGDVLLQLSDTNLKDLGIQSIGKRIKLLKAIRKLQDRNLLSSISRCSLRDDTEVPDESITSKLQP
ncbi:hypothetical protein H4R34_003239 [Dimargaris verticillata]|uniref:SAM domain-containing protein n=1 Tax=Dimargaris verticillata TaxID=2761393 RepID=A0A9W8EC70_9FUNG|nr:hypothetical protein H4R34_003239 [Dimargaris verticillata]